MAVIIESNTEPKEQLVDALKTAGYTAVEEPKPEPLKAGETTSEQSGAPGGNPAETEGKSAAATEAASSQEKPQGEETEGKPLGDKVETTVAPAEKKSKGGFQSKLETKTRQLEEAREQLELERGDKSKLQSKIAELEAQIQEFKPREAEQPADPVKPRRPTRAECDYDEDKYEQALANYDEELTGYHQAVTDLKVAEKLAEADRQRQQREQSAAAERAWNAYLARVNADRSEIPDWDDVFEPLTESINIPEAAEAAILESEHPGHLTFYYASNLEELDKLTELSPVAQVREIARIEIRLANERALKANPTKDEKHKAEGSPEEKKAPAKQETRPKTLDQPIEPVGATASTKTLSLEELAEKANAGDKDAKKKIHQMVNQGLAKRQSR